MTSLAIDIGAESGRGIVGVEDNGRLAIREVHRFPNIPLHIDGSLRWDLDLLVEGVKDCLSKAGPVDTVGIDTWGVDYVLLDSNGEVLEPPYHHRDALTDGAMEEAFKIVSREEIYALTGIQFMQFNSLFQLFAMSRRGSPALRSAAQFLTIPDYLNHVLTGASVSEFTNATTTQCYNPREKKWAAGLLQTLGIPTHIFPEIVHPGTLLGTYNGGRVIAPACHDTGSAVAAISGEGQDHAWISSGTWSIMGITLPKPIITPETCAESFTNEGGVGGTFRFCKNVMGLWILQQCRAAWEGEGQHFSYAELVDLAAGASPNCPTFDVDRPEFLKPGDMPSKVADAAGLAHDAPGLVTRVVLKSLAAKYAEVFAKLQKLSGKQLDMIHIIGGGSQNELLNQLTADACHVPVIAGPAEATAIGNLLVQMGPIIKDRSFDEKRFSPAS
jgi:rhamnulokinase